MYMQVIDQLISKLSEPQVILLQKDPDYAKTGQSSVDLERIARIYGFDTEKTILVFPHLLKTLDKRILNSIYFWFYEGKLHYSVNKVSNGFHPVKVKDDESLMCLDYGNSTTYYNLLAAFSKAFSKNTNNVYAIIRKGSYMTYEDRGNFISLVPFKISELPLLSDKKR